MEVKKRVLFLSMHNAARSQMAEALLRDFADEKFDVFSAGVEPTQIDPLAAASMQEIGIDIAHNRCKPIDLYEGETFDYVVTLCATSSESCPSFPGAKQSLVWNFVSPSTFTGSEDQRLQSLRDFRDALSLKIHQELLRN